MIRLLLIAGFGLMLFGYSPYILDDTRFDGGLMGIWAVALAAACWWLRAAAPNQTSVRLIWLGCALGVVPLFLGDLRWDWVVGGLADRAAWIAATVVLCCALARPNCLERSWKPIFMAAGGVAALICLQILGLDLFGWRLHRDLPATGSFSNRPQAAEFLVVALLAALGYTFSRRQVDPRHWAGLALPAAFCAGYLDITAARVALAAGLILLLWQRRSAMRVAGIAVVLLFVGGELTRVATQPAWTTREANEAGSEAFETVHGRGLLYTSVAAKIVRTPLGIGIGRFERDYPRWRSLEEERLTSSSETALANRTVKTPHNEALLILLELGWLGGLIVLFALFRLVRDPQRARWADPALLALALFAAFRSPLSDHGPLLALAVLLLAARRQGTHNPSSAAKTRLDALPAWTPCLALAAIAVLPAPAHIVGETLVAQRMPLANEDGTRTEAQPELLTRAVKWRPWDSLAWDLLASDLSDNPETHPLEVRAALLEALRYDSADLYALTRLFKLDLLQGRTDSALQFLWVAEQYAPHHPAVYHNRTTYIRTRAEAYRLSGRRALDAGTPGAHQQLFYSQLWLALKEIRDGNNLRSAKALRASVYYAERDKGLIERVANDPELDISRVQELLLRLLPGEEKAIGVRLSRTPIE